MSQKILSTFTAAALLPLAAYAFDLLDGNGNCPGGISWTADQEYTISTANNTFGDFLQMATAASEVVARVNRVGGQSFDIAETFDPVTAIPTSGNDVNEIGMVTTLAANVRARAVVTFNTNTCEIVEADIEVNESFDWLFGVPEDHGADYFDAGIGTGGATRYFRTTFLHEVGHSMGLAHSDHSYSFMNYNIRPWSNRVDEKQIEPLPDDREALRHLYGDGTSELDIAVLNTWFDANDLTNGAASQQLLCRPASGSLFSADRFSDFCGATHIGASGPTEVCPGDLLYTRYAIANYGTEGLNVSEQLWLSTDTWLDEGVDKRALRTHSSSHGGNSSLRVGRVFEVPSSVSYSTEYYPILLLDHRSIASEESQQNNWIPLRSTIRIKSWFDCNYAKK